MMIETVGLRKSFKTRTGTVDAVRGVDLQVREGEIFGFLGPNGAGKTTTLRMLATLIEPDGGTATVAGADLRKASGEVRRRIGYVAQGGSTWDEVSAREELVLQARLYGMSKAEATSRAARALDAFQLTEYADRKCKTYSGGSAGGWTSRSASSTSRRSSSWTSDHRLDPQSARTCGTRCAGCATRPHHLPDHALPRRGRRALRRISIMDNGEIVAEGTPDELKREISGDVLTLGVPAPSRRRRASCSPTAPSVRGHRVRRPPVRGEGAPLIPSLMRTMDTAGIAVSGIELHRPAWTTCSWPRPAARCGKLRRRDEARPRHLAALPAPVHPRAA